MWNKEVLFWTLQTRTNLREQRRARSLLRDPIPSTFDFLHSVFEGNSTRLHEFHIECALVSEQMQNGLQVVTADDVSIRVGKNFRHEFPLAFAYRGNLDLLRLPRVAIIGSRHPTLYGREQCFRFAKELSEKGFLIISGGAIGIDTIANRTAHDFGKTCAVVGGGIFSAHPPSNFELFNRMTLSENALLLSEFRENEHAQKWHFPRRNHSIAELADFVLVIEAGSTSGTLITVDAALQYGADVGALPGPIDAETSVGTNSLIRDGAFCIQSPRDVIERMSSLAILKKHSEPNNNLQTKTEVNSLGLLQH